MKYTKIRQKRKEMHLSQKKVADMTGLSIQSIHNIETGRFAPSLKSLQLLSKTFNCSIQELIEEVEL